MSYEIFLSYSRSDTALCDRVAGLIKRLGYTVFVDRELEAGSLWEEELTRAIENPIRPEVVLLATRGAVARPEYINEELRLARQQDLSVVAIGVDPRAAETLLGTTLYQWIEWPSGEDDSALEGQLRVALRRRVRQALSRFRKAAHEWVDQRLARARHADFWEGTWSDFIDPSNGDSLVLTAGAGGGKTTVIAHFVSDILNDGNVFPVIVSEELLRKGTAALGEALFSRPGESLRQHLCELQARWQWRVVFIVDGLDQVAFADEGQQQRIGAALAGLAEAAQTVVGCRDATWTTYYADALLAFKAVPLEELGVETVRAALRRRGYVGPDPESHALLRIPLFLDLTLRRRRSWQSIPSSQSALLNEVLVDVRASYPDGPNSGPEDVDEFLRALAEEQLGHVTYWIASDALRARHTSFDRFKGVAKYLERERFVVRNGQSNTLRLSHDLLDGFNMARLLVNDEASRRAFYQRFETGCGWAVLAVMVKAASERGLEPVLDEVFEQFLRVLDRKNVDESNNVRAWRVTDILKERIDELLPRIIRCLSGERVPDLVPETLDELGSRLQPPRATQATASTLASAFLGMRHGDPRHADWVVPVLHAGLHKWGRRGRFVEALAKYDCDEAVAAVVELGRESLQTRQDLGVLFYVARALGSFSLAARDADELLRSIRDDTSLELETRFRAREALARRAGDAPPISLEEERWISGLRPSDRDGYTDWQRVKLAAAEVQGAISRGRSVSSDVVAALIGSLQHAQTAVRIPLVEVLGRVHDARSSTALIAELTRMPGRPEYRQACYAALEQQLRHRSAPDARQALRLSLLWASRVTGETDAQKSLVDLAASARLLGAGDWLVDEQCLEIVPPPTTPVNPRVEVTLLHEEDASLDRAIVARVSPAALAEAGPEWEPKYRVTSVARDADGSLRVSLARTSWPLAKAFHESLRRHPEQFSSSSVILGPWPHPSLISHPNLASVHCVILTSDGSLLLAKRAPSAAFWPNHWSASFEEQITNSDLEHGPDAALVACIRGMHEEFGVEIDASRVTPLSVALEVAGLSPALVLLVEPPLTFEEIEARRNREPLPIHADEATRLCRVEGTLESLDTLLLRQTCDELLHPTSRMRVAMLVRYLKARRAGRGSEGHFS